MIRHTANLLGALSLRITDLMRANVDKATGFSGEAAAALVTIEAEPDNSIGFVASVIGLSHSGTVRLIDKLVAERLVDRRRGKNARTMALRVTRDGKARVKDLHTAREVAVLEILKNFSDEQASSLDDILNLLLADLVTEPIHEHIICRLCDSKTCFQGGCPITDRCRRLDSGGAE